MFREQAKTKRMRLSISQKPLKGYIIYVISRKKIGLAEGDVRGISCFGFDFGWNRQKGKYSHLKITVFLDVERHATNNTTHINNFDEMY